MSTEVWIAGGAGRSGRVIAAELLSRGITPVLTGRAAARLAEGARQAGGGRTLVVASVTELAAEIRRQQPAVVINTIGPFAETAPPLIEACLEGSDYLDLANDVASVLTVLGYGDRAAAAGRTALTGAGFGVTATESVVVRLCQGRPVPARVRVDMLPSVSIEAGPLGDALAASMLDGLPGVPGGGRYQGRRYDSGHLTATRLSSDVAHLRLPDGTEAATATMPLGELIAAQRASGAPSVVSASSEMPSSPVIQAVLPLATALLRIGPVRAFAKSRLARVQLKARKPPREHSWGHAVVTWPDGTVREGWLRLGDAQVFTGAVPAEIARRLLAGQGRPGAFTPAALFGPDLAEAAGAEYLIADAPAAA
jgi:short subunit dehydrogenase-like uncharacterized protein